MAKNRKTIRGTWDCNDPAWTEPQTDEEWVEYWARFEQDAQRAENAYWERRLEEERNGDDRG